MTVTAIIPVTGTAVATITLPPPKAPGTLGPFEVMGYKRPAEAADHKPPSKAAGHEEQGRVIDHKPTLGASPPRQASSLKPEPEHEPEHKHKELARRPKGQYNLTLLGAP